MNIYGRGHVCVSWGKFEKVAMNNPCFGWELLAASYHDHVAVELRRLSIQKISFMSFTVVTSKYGNVLSFVVNWCPLSCCRKHLSLHTCCRCCPCNDHSFEQGVLFILTSNLLSYHCWWYPTIKYIDERGGHLFHLYQRRNILLFLFLFLFIVWLVVKYMVVSLEEDSEQCSWSRIICCCCRCRCCCPCCCCSGCTSRCLPGANN